jgi:hypothetical protein
MVFVAGSVGQLLLPKGESSLELRARDFPVSTSLFLVWPENQHTRWLWKMDAPPRGAVSCYPAPI